MVAEHGEAEGGSPQPSSVIGVGISKCMKRITQLNASFWLALVAYLVGGSALFFITFKVAPFFSNLGDSYPIPIRVVTFVGPFGWLAVAFFGALATLLVRSTIWRLASTITFCCLTIGVICTVMFTSLDCPTSIIVRP
jgi:hypothetical protein